MSDSGENFRSALQAILRVSSTALLFCGPLGAAIGMSLALADCAMETFARKPAEASAVEDLRTDTAELTTAVAELLLKDHIVDLDARVDTFVGWMNDNSEFFDHPSIHDLDFMEVNILLFGP